MASMASSTSPLDTVDEEFDFGRSMTEDFTSSTQKRTRADGRSDAISACWTSAVCPNHSKDGIPPNPSTCGGGCAPYLFGVEPLPDSNNDDALDMTIIGVDDLAVDPSVTLKRRESSTSSPPPQGRPLANITTGLTNSSSPDVLESIEHHSNNKKSSRQPHNKVEQKYRDSINNQMEALRRVVPTLCETPPRCSSDPDIEDLPAPTKPSKAVILGNATAYIKTQTKEMKQLQAHNALLRQRINDLQALVKCDDCSLMKYMVGLNLQDGPLQNGLLNANCPANRR